MKHKTIRTIAIMTFGIASIVSCRKDTEVIQTENSPNFFSDISMVTGPGSEGLMEFAPQTPNPYTLSNMQAALDSLSSRNELQCDISKFQIRVTHKYIKFKPDDSVQYERLLDDTSLILFDYPLDRKITKGGTYYRDPSLPEGKPNFQWCCVKANKELPAGVPFDLIADLYLPEEDPNLFQYYNTEFDHCITLLIDEALKRTGNYDTSNYYGGMTSGGDLVSLKLPSKWTPAGNIRRTDNRLNSNIGLEGAKVRAHRWFETRECLTDVNGNFNMGWQFRYPVDYSIKWERQDFDIRSGTFGQAYFNGPHQRGDWNLVINSGKSRHYAHIFRAGIDYFYKCPSQFSLTPPPANTFWNPRLHIAAHDKDKTSHNATTHPFSRPLSVFPIMDFYNPNRRSDFIYGTAIHEIAHYAHWGYNKNGFNTGEDRVAESFAEGIEWVFCTWRYESYGDANDAAMTTGGTDSYQERVRAGTRFNNNSAFFSTYTPLVVDLMDEENQRNTRGHNGSTDWPIDRVSGYSINQIETSFKKSKTWTEWRTNLFNDHSNSTENNLQELFDNW
jgi:hypothetical protein